MQTTSTPTYTRLDPTRIAADTYVIHHHQGEGTAPVAVALNSMVIVGAEPVVVDTGVAENREQFLEDLFGLVDPMDVRWVYISHDDVDHTGNLNAVMDACPNATAIINWFMVERMGADLQSPPSRWRWVGDGESFQAGDRRLHAIRPPIFDSPTTRGLYDESTGVYWASDSFATPMLQPVTHVSELDTEFWTTGINTFDNYVARWLELVNDTRFQRTVDRVEALRATAMAGCHTPVIESAFIPTALAATRWSPHASVAPEPDQAVLEQIQATLMEQAA